MERICTVSWIVVLFTVLQIRKADVQQEAPYNPCSDNFEYVRTPSGLGGRVTLRGLPLVTTKVEVAFSQNAYLGNYYGSLSLANDLQATFASLRDKGTITYDVDFPNKNIYPRLTSIRVNEVSLCGGDAYTAPGTSTFRLSHTFIPSTTTTTVYRPSFPSYPTYTPTYHVNNKNPFLPDVPYYTPPTRRPAQTPTRATTTTTRRTIFKNPNNGFDGNIWLTNTKATTPTPKPTFFSPDPPINRIGDSNVLASNNKFKCGDEGVGSFVIGGKELRPGEFPWLSAIYIEQRFECGGSLISQRTIITAAHCFVTTSDPTKVFATVGRHDLTNIDPSGNDIRSVVNIVSHPNFNVQKLPDADIALLHLSAPVIFSNQLKPVCLWRFGTDESQIVDKKASVAGWGATESGRFSPTPNKIEVPITSRDHCREETPTLESSITSRTICAGNRDRNGPCRGDSGGGLLIYIYGAFHLKGIVSGGSVVRGQCDLLSYVLYTDVGFYTDWIDHNTVD